MTGDPAPVSGFILSGARLAGRAGLWDIGVTDGRIHAIEPRLDTGLPRVEAGGALAFGGFVETHIHLDKALILDRCPLCHGTLSEAIALTARAKAGFTVADVADRATRAVEMAILQGTTRLRSFVEIDPRAGFRGLEALQGVQASHAWAIDIELCAFAQEGLTQEPATLGMLAEALESGVPALGGCPYTDADPVAHVAAIFDLAERHGVEAVDFHADFDLNPAGSILPEIIAQTEARGWQGQVSVGHATKLSVLPGDQFDALADGLARAGIAVTVLPATDLHLAPRGPDGTAPRGLAPAERLRARGVTVSLASNNILNPFTPHGDASLLRMAALYANVAQLSREAEFAAAFAMVTTEAARLLRQPHERVVGGPLVGGPADLVLIDAPGPAEAVQRHAAVLAGWKAGRQSFRRPRAELLRPPQSG